MAAFSFCCWSGASTSPSRGAGAGAAGVVEGDPAPRVGRGVAGGTAAWGGVDGAAGALTDSAGCGAGAGGDGATDGGETFDSAPADAGGGEGRGTAACLFRHDDSDAATARTSERMKALANTFAAKSGASRCRTEELTVVIRHSRKPQAEGRALSRLTDKVDCTTVKLNHSESGG